MIFHDNHWELWQRYNFNADEDVLQRPFLDPHARPLKFGGLLYVGQRGVKELMITAGKSAAIERLRAISQRGKTQGPRDQAFLSYPRQKVP